MLDRVSAAERKVPLIEQFDRQHTAHFHAPSITRARIAGWSFALVSAVALLTAIAQIPSFLDYPVTLLVNRFGPRHPLIETLARDFGHFYSVSGMLFVFGIWYCWFSSPIEAKSRLMVGSLAAFGSGILSRLLQHVLPSHHRPLHDPLLGFHAPSVVEPDALNGWSSFPSDHAAVWFGVATVVAINRPRLGAAALMLALITNAARNYLGYHYPTDILAGGELGGLLVWLSQADLFQRPGRAVIAWGERHTPLFYAGAIFVSYQIATLCDDMRQIAGGIADALGLRSS